MTIHLTSIRFSFLVLMVILVFYISEDASAQSSINYSYEDVFSSDASKYIYSTTNIETTAEPNNDYLNPIVAGEDAQITYLFTLDAPITTASLNAQLGMFNFAGSSGSGSLWASTDNTNWQLLVDAPTPTTESAAYVYDQELPSSLLGSDSIYIQARLLSSGDNIFAQFSRTDDTYNSDNPSYNIFTFGADSVPEPAPIKLLFISTVILTCSSMGRKFLLRTSP